MSSLSEQFPAGAGKEVSFVASGTIATGDTVILNSDGTVSAVSGQAYVVGSKASASTTSGDYTTGVFDSTNNKVVVVWEDGNNTYGAVGTVSGLSISFGSATQILTNRSANSYHLAFDSGSSKIVFVYRDDGSGANNYGQAVVLNVSGSSLSAGTPVTFISGTIYEPRVVYDSTNNKSVVFCRDSTNSFRGSALVATVSGTSISFGTKATFSSSTNEESIDACFDSNAGKTVTTFRDSTASGRAIVGTVSGTSISFGTAVTFSTVATSISQPRPTVFDSVNNKVVVLYKNGSADQLAASVGTVSGTSISFVNPVVTSGVPATVNNGQNWSATFDPDQGCVVFFVKSDANIGYINTFKADTREFGSVFYSTESITTNYTYSQVVYDTNANKNVVCTQDNTNSAKATSWVFDTPLTNVTDDNFLGISTGAISNAASGSITIKGGVSSNVSGLTPNSLYYIQNDGSLANADSIPFRLVGAFYDSKSFAFNAQDGDAYALAFKSDGTKMYMVGSSGDNVYQYSLSTAYDVSTGAYDSVSFDISGQSILSRDIRFNASGSKMYIMQYQGTIYEYDLSTPWDLSTASYNSASFSVATQTSAPYSIFFKTDGTKLFVVGDAGDSVYQYSLSTAFDITSASYDSVSFSISSQTTSPTGLVFSSDGTTMLVGDRSGTSEVFKYTLSTAWDLSTASYASESFATDTQTGSLWDIVINNNGTKLYALGNTNDSVHQYSMGTGTDTFLAGRALSATSIDLDYST